MDHGTSGAEFEKHFIKCLDEAAEDLIFLRRVANKSFRYMELYDKGATGALAEFANKKYQGHRAVPQAWLTEDMKSEFKAKYKEEAKESVIDWKKLEEDRKEQRSVVANRRPVGRRRPKPKPRRKRRARDDSSLSGTDTPEDAAAAPVVPLARGSKSTRKVRPSRKLQEQQEHGGASSDSDS